MFQPLSVEVVRDSGPTRVVVAGELDLATVPELVARLAGTLQSEGVEVRDDAAVLVMVTDP